MSNLIKNVEHARTFELKELVALESGRVNSLSLSQTPGCKATVFAIDAGEGMSTHAAPGDALVTCLEGSVQITLEGVEHVLGPGTSLVMTAGAPHAVKALEPVKMLLIVVRPS
ncbi:cupin domain-containing protein [Eggerthellaceae bacterium zg-1084]|uniref:Cupin domain-containing protein n=1 Tax=Berryella wangjianweii TaxID=2734634 RepID=A0A6M8J8C1_9ACTN|nr:cupin domain-containing protein [Berryella wangjianweii]NPD31644.1 cupin domain-containing protein [Berryella wangjianweii]NPD32861.1 cupin domain-containing protein [Eggerthellaceae bacterium zg-997]QKF07738.1 cupin domain-containing protein [Berryella wangjianweii]